LLAWQFGHRAIRTSRLRDAVGERLLCKSEQEERGEFYVGDDREVI